jgi:chromosome segregation ATPase
MITETGQHPADTDAVALDLMDEATTEALKEEILAAALGAVQERLDSADQMRRQAMEIYADLLERQTTSLAGLTEQTEAERLRLKEQTRILELALEQAQVEIDTLENRLRETATQGAPASQLESELRDAIQRLERRNEIAANTSQALRDEMTAAREALAAAEEQIADRDRRIDELLRRNAALSNELRLIQDQWEQMQAPSVT